MKGYLTWPTRPLYPSMTKNSCLISVLNDQSINQTVYSQLYKLNTYIYFQLRVSSSITKHAPCPWVSPFFIFFFTIYFLHLFDVPNLFFFSFFQSLNISEVIFLYVSIIFVSFCIIPSLIQPHMMVFDLQRVRNSKDKPDVRQM